MEHYWQCSNNAWCILQGSVATLSWWELLHVFCLKFYPLFEQWKTFENRFRFGKVIAIIQHHLSWDTLYSISLEQAHDFSLQFPLTTWFIISWMFVFFLRLSFALSFTMTTQMCDAFFVVSFTPTTVDVIAVMKMAQYVSGTCRRHACHTYTHCLPHTYLVKKLCHHSRLPVISTLTMNGHHFEEYVLLLNYWDSCLNTFVFYMHLLNVTTKRRDADQ